MSPFWRKKREPTPEDQQVQDMTQTFLEAVAAGFVPPDVVKEVFSGSRRVAGYPDAFAPGERFNLGESARFVSLIKEWADKYKEAPLHIHISPNDDKK